MRTFASFITNNARAAGPGARPGARPGDPGARITAQVFAIGPNPGGRS